MQDLEIESLGESDRDSQFQLDKGDFVVDMLQGTQIKLYKALT